VETLKSNIQNNKQLYMLVIIFLALFILMSILSPSKFLTSNNISSMMFQMSELGVLAIGMSIVILTGGINLALSHSSMLAAIIGTLVMQAMVSAGMNPLLTILAGIIVIIAVSLILGAINGFFIAYVGVLPILVTLGTRRCRYICIGIIFLKISIPFYVF